MKECINCKAKNRTSDIYCRNCGCYIKNNRPYIIVNIMIALLVLAIVLLIILFISSYIIVK